MSSIPQQEPMKPAPKSPIPRSRSDFSYVGLTPKEKRWTTDFSLLLPPFTRDTSGYSRLAESPVTLQPKPRNQAVVKLSKSPTLDPSVIQSEKSSETKSSGKSPTSEPGTSRTSSNDGNYKTFKDSKPIGRSQTMEPYIANGGISSNNSNESKRTIYCKTMSRSPTLEPYATNCTSISSNESKRSIASKTLSRNTNLVNHLPKCSSSCSKTPSESKTLYPKMELSPIGCPKTAHRLSPLTNPSAGECSRHLSSIRKSPTMDSKTLRYSPLLNQQIISRSPTLDPSVLNRSPRCCHATVTNGPVGSRGSLVSRGLSPEVVRSQSLRSLRKGMDRSPSKMRTSESAQTDVSCSIHK
ncbi:hypothetical protein HNY73_018530 [Argiope bruennichi]|uniref:Uncharacterized protein n=2 Tax=Argiope bruennichi TaxID=94029 RepID=A0A8T0EDJ2_ARGBR|nr:hypothetical protein HNY73_018530 [Argiope bruennichi]